MLRLLSKAGFEFNRFGNHSFHKTQQLFEANGKNMELKDICAVLNQIAPERLAESWDNVGLLVEPTTPHTVSTMLLTNDLTEDVLEEAVAISANLIVSYHPPIFRPLKKLTTKSWKERIVVKAIENRIAIYSTHTASDAVVNGATDWLSKSVGELSDARPINQSYEAPKLSKHVSFCVNESSEYTKAEVLNSLQNKFSNVQFNIQTSEENVAFLSCACNPNDVSQITELCENVFPNNCCDINIYDLANKPVFKCGSGRICVLKFPSSLFSIVDRVKQFINVNHIRVAVGKNTDINTQCKTVALVPGSGASVLNGVDADIYLTGEMSHHEILEATSNGRSVILCEHSNSERGYMIVLKSILDDLLDDKVNVFISNSDRDPIEIM